MESLRKIGGFTLIELTLVLAVLAIVAHLAVREISHIVDTKKYDAANRQLTEIAAAVISDDWEFGFLPDMGRMPCATNFPSDSSALSLAELYSGEYNYDIRKASTQNIVGEAVVDDSVSIPCGWRGPYLHLPFSSKRLTDPWGNPIESPDSAGYCRLLDSESNIVERASTPVYFVRHFGSDGQPDDISGAINVYKSDQRDNVIPLISGGCINSTVTLSRDFFANKLGLESALELTCMISVRWYSPFGDKITGGAGYVGVGSNTVTFAGLTPGPKYIKAVVGGGEESILKKIIARPGSNYF